MPLEQPSLKGRALRLLSTREHSRAELERKLAEYEESAGQLARVLDDLTTRGFINDQRVLESVLHRRAAKLGAARIRKELQGKGLDPSAIQAAVATLQSDEAARAQAVWLRKFGEPAADAREAGRQMRFLAARGFGAEVIRRVVSGRFGDEASH